MKECTHEENLIMASMLQLGVEQGLRARLGLPSLFAVKVSEPEHRAVVLHAEKAWVDRLAIEAEREACAKLVEEWCWENGAETYRDYERSDDAGATCRKAAAAIRARGAK